MGLLHVICARLRSISFCSNSCLKINEYEYCCRYGHPKPDTATGLAERMKMFHWDKIDLATADDAPEPFKKKGNRGNGGWTTKRSFEGLVRRLLHAIMTSGTFTVVLAGHSAAAGHG